MTAARKSRPECIASDKMPKLPVRATRKILSESRRTAEPTDASAARRFSREACWSWIQSHRQIIRCASRLLGAAAERSTNGRATRFAVEAADFDFVEQQRRSDNRAGNAALGRTKGAERGSGESAGRILHVGENGFVVTDTRECCAESAAASLRCVRRGPFLRGRRKHKRDTSPAEFVRRWRHRRQRRR